MFKVTNFEKLLDKATSNLKLEPDWPTIMQICDLIRQGDVTAKNALSSIKKKMQSQNPHVATFALLVLESVVKNCGHHVHDEIGTKTFMEHLRELVKNTQHEQVKSKILELVQAWAFAFRSNPKYVAVKEALVILKAEGYSFPPLVENDAMFCADTAPEWVDATVCHRCRTTFTMVLRKHHCRACGNVFCGACSAKTCILPKFGIEKEVRVCDACYELHNKPRPSSPHSKAENESLPAVYLSSSLAQQSQNPKPKKTEEELKEEEDIQLALALSQSEAEAKEKEKKRLTSEIINNAATLKKTPTVVKEEEEEDDPELARYLNRSYWEKRQAEEKAEKKSPEHFRSNAGGPPSAPTTPTHQLENGEVSESDLNDFMACLKSQVEIFVNRMKSNSSRGRSISNDSSVQTLFMNVTMNHSTLLRYIHQQDDSRVYYEGLQDKLAQIKDALMALDALRDEHREKLRREAEEAERQKQLQMAQKLEIMRRRKQEYLQLQRQLAIQKMQEQEREMQMRQEHQKQQYLMGSMGTLAMAQNFNAWDSKMSSLQSPPQQFGQQYASLPAVNPATTGYVIPGSTTTLTQQTNQIPVVPPQSVMPPNPVGPVGPRLLPLQHPQLGTMMPPQQGQPRVFNVQPNQGPISNPPITQMHPHHMQPNFQGMHMPGPNPLASATAAPPMITHTQSLILPSNRHMNVGVPPQSGPSSVALPSNVQQKVNIHPNTPQGHVSGSQHRLGQGHIQNPAIAVQDISLQEGVSQNMGVQSVTQNTSQQFQQVPPNGEQCHSSGSTGELISFD